MRPHQLQLRVTPVQFFFVYLHLLFFYFLYHFLQYPVNQLLLIILQVQIRNFLNLSVSNFFHNRYKLIHGMQITFYHISINKKHNNNRHRSKYQKNHFSYRHLMQIRFTDLAKIPDITSIYFLSKKILFSGMFP